MSGGSVGAVAVPNIRSARPGRRTNATIQVARTMQTLVSNNDPTYNELVAQSVVFVCKKTEMARPSRANAQVVHMRGVGWMNMQLARHPVDRNDALGLNFIFRTPVVTELKDYTNDSLLPNRLKEDQSNPTGMSMRAYTPLDSDPSFDLSFIRDELLNQTFGDIEGNPISLEQSRYVDLEHTPRVGNPAKYDALARLLYEWRVDGVVINDQVKEIKNGSIVDSHTTFNVAVRGPCNVRNANVSSYNAGQSAIAGDAPSITKVMKDVPQEFDPHPQCGDAYLLCLHLVPDSAPDKMRFEYRYWSARRLEEIAKRFLTRSGASRDPLGPFPVYPHGMNPIPGEVAQDDGKRFNRSALSALHILEEQLFATIVGAWRIGRVIDTHAAVDQDEQRVPFLIGGQQVRVAVSRVNVDVKWMGLLDMRQVYGTNAMEPTLYGAGSGLSYPGASVVLGLEYDARGLRCLPIDIGEVYATLSRVDRSVDSFYELFLGYNKAYNQRIRGQFVTPFALKAFTLVETLRLFMSAVNIYYADIRNEGSVEAKNVKKDIASVFNAQFENELNKKSDRFAALQTYTLQQKYRDNVKRLDAEIREFKTSPDSYGFISDTSDCTDVDGNEMLKAKKALVKLKTDALDLIEKFMDQTGRFPGEYMNDVNANGLDGMRRFIGIVTNYFESDRERKRNLKRKIGNSILDALKKQQQEVKKKEEALLKLQRAFRSAKDKSAASVNPSPSPSPGTRLTVYEAQADLASSKIRLHMIERMMEQISFLTPMAALQAKNFLEGGTVEELLAVQAQLGIPVDDTAALLMPPPPSQPPLAPQPPPQPQPTQPSQPSQLPEGSGIASQSLTDFMRGTGIMRDFVQQSRATPSTQSSSGDRVSDAISAASDALNDYVMGDASNSADSRSSSSASRPSSNEGSRKGSRSSTPSRKRTSSSRQVEDHGAGAIPTDLQLQIEDDEELQTVRLPEKQSSKSLKRQQRGSGSQD